MSDMPLMRPVELVQDFIGKHLKPADITIDATAGNGHDSCFLARLVGSEGHVFCIDIQAEALANTAHRLAAEQLDRRTTLIQGDHARLTQLIPLDTQPRIRAIMFNLGYLPGGDKRIVTRADSTRAAIRAALTLLPETGVMSIVSYRGHPGGQADHDAVAATLAERGRRYRCEETPGDGPVAWLIGSGYSAD
ncbi:MAG TPA: methyltransferase domain-containing protein [Chromatiaceae bacterium]|nr:methyltransferase domain-containing protein [Chromatiaceae bacterium]